MPKQTLVIEYHCVSHSESKLYLDIPFVSFFFTHSLELWNPTCDEVKKLTIMQFDFTIVTASSNLHRSLASKFKACNVQGRTMICLCLTLSKGRNLIMELGLSVQQHFIWAQLMQLELTIFDTSNNKIYTVPLSCRDTTFPVFETDLLFKSIIDSNEHFDFEYYLGMHADIIHNRHLEAAIIKVQSSKEDTLTWQELPGVKDLLLPAQHIDQPGEYEDN
jgi:hypothetical protein